MKVEMTLAWVLGRRALMTLPCCLTLVALSPAACGGNAFDSKEADGAAGDTHSMGGERAAAAGAGGTTPDSPAGGTGASEGGDGSITVGGAPSGEAGEPGIDSGGAANGGAAGMPSLSLCEQVGVGVEFGEHCYVDITAGKLWTQSQSIGQCDALGQSLGRQGRLLVLDTPEEQAFVVTSFLQGLEATHDAWLSLMCPQAIYPELSECFCINCGEAELFSKRQNWLWPGGFSTGFGWHSVNPNGDGRCAALTYNEGTQAWGWGDRPCDGNQFPVDNGNKRSYRIICEVF